MHERVNIIINNRLVSVCRGYCEMCRKYKMKFGGSTCSSQVISLTKQKQSLNNFKIKVYYSAGILYQRTHNVVVVAVFAFGVRRNGNVFARQRGASQVLDGLREQSSGVA